MNSIKEADCPTCDSNRIKLEEIENQGFIKTYIFKCKPRFECLECDTLFSPDGIEEKAIQEHIETAVQSCDTNKDTDSIYSINTKAKLLFGVLASITLVQWVLLWNTL